MGSLKTALLAGALAASAGFAHAADYLPPPPPPEPLPLKGTIGDGWYLRGDIGVGSQSYKDLEVKSNNAPVIATAGVSSFDTIKGERSFAAFAGAGIGYQFNSWFRADITAEYRGASIHGRDRISYDFGVPTHQINNYRGDVATFVTLVNAYVELGTWKCLTPYLGAGIGFAHHTINGFSDNGIVEPDGGGASVAYAYADSTSKTSFAWALMAGVSYDVTSNLKLDIGYRYLHMGDGPTMGLAGAKGLLVNPSSSVRFKGIDSHDIRIGMRWNFGDPNCCGKEEPPPVYAPHVVRKF